MKKMTLCIAATFVIATNCFSENESGKKDEHYWVFDGVELWAEHKSKLAPVVGSSGRRLILDTTDGMKRVYFSAHCEPQDRLSASNVLVDISDLKYTFGGGGTYHNNVGDELGGSSEGTSRHYVVANMSINSPVEMENAYCVFQAGAAGVQVRRLGTLQVGIPTRVKMALFSKELMEKGDCSVYLFSENGQPLATTESLGLQMLTENEYLKLQGFKLSNG